MDSVRINNGVGVVTPTKSGSVAVRPNTTTTYVATVTGGDQDGDCRATVTLKVPPPPPPPPPAPHCVSLVASPAVITSPGQQVTLTWRTANASSVRITPDVGSVTPVTTGSVTVRPTGDVTYTATVPNAPANPNCKATVTLDVPPPTITPRCVDLSANKTSIEEGENVVLTWVTRNASSVRITPDVGSVTPVHTGSVTVRPREDTTYQAIVPGAPKNDACEVRINVEEERDRDRSRNRDRDEEPESFLASFSRPAEPPLASVYLSEIPYTGLDLGPVGTVIYWVMLTVWSGAASYLVFFTLVPGVLRRVRGRNENDDDGYATYQESMNAPAAQPMPIQSLAAAPSRPYSQNEGFRSYGQDDSLTIDDIVKGLSRESGMTFDRGEASNAEEQVSQRAQEHTPAHEATEYADDIPSFLEALLNGDRDEVFGTVRELNKQGGDAEHFLSQAVCALDDAYRARVEGTECHLAIIRITEDCHTSFLEKIVSSLATAVDASYSKGVTGTKLALTRALAIVNG